MEPSIDQLFSLLYQAQSEKNSIWTFYVIIVTTILGVSFNDKYQELPFPVRVFITLASGFAVWFNFTALVMNSMQIDVLFEYITNQEPVYYQILGHVRTLDFSWSITALPLIMWVLINLALFVSLWYREFAALFYKIKNIYHHK